MSHGTGQDATTRRVAQRIDQYAALHGISVGAVRKRIQRGQLDAHKGEDHRWYVLDAVPRDESGQDTRQDATGQDATTAPVTTVIVNPNARAQLEAIRDEWLQPLVGTIAEQAERIGRLEHERDGQADTIAELRGRAEVAEAALAAASATPTPPAPPSDEAARPAPDSTPVAPGGAQGLRAWLRRVFGGE
jgi:hypothetical protein